MDRVNRAAVALGSNVGDRGGHLAYAVSRLADYFTSLKVSRSVTTAPVNVPGDQPDFLNAAAELRTNLSPRGLLNLCLDAERRLKRVRSERWGPRLIDMDILVFGDRILDEEGLELPHPRMLQRAFVLVPLAEIAADFRIDGLPVSGHLAKLDAGGIEKLPGRDWWKN